MKSISLILLVLVSACSLLPEKPVKNPKVKVSEVKVEDVDLDNTTLGFVLSVDNPNPIHFDVTELNYELQVDGKKVTSGEEAYDKKIEAKKVSAVKVPLTFSNQELLGAMGELATLNKTPYKISGMIRVGVLPIPFEKTGELDASEWFVGE